jgi:hypothetical protein
MVMIEDRTGARYGPFARLRATQRVETPDARADGGVQWIFDGHVSAANGGDTMNRIYDSRLYVEMTTSLSRAIMAAVLGMLLLVAGIAVFAV